MTSLVFIVKNCHNVDVVGPKSLQALTRLYIFSGLSYWVILFF